MISVRSLTVFYLHITVRLELLECANLRWPNRQSRSLLLCQNALLLCWLIMIEWLLIVVSYEVARMIYGVFVLKKKKVVIMPNFI